MSKKRRRPQAPKPRNLEFNRAMMEKGRSSGTRPIPSGTAYKRKSKYREF